MSNPNKDQQDKLKQDKLQISEVEIDEAIETALRDAEEEGAVTLNIGC